MPTYQWRVHLLEDFALYAGSDKVHIGPVPQRVLAYLALSEHGARRSSLTSALWPDVDERRAAANLRTVLWRLPPRCRNVIDGDGSRIRLADGVGCDVIDLTGRARRLIDGRPEDDDLAIGGLLHELLPAWYDDWLSIERERLRQLRLHALDQLSASLCRLGRYAQAIEAALITVAIEPLRESAHTRLIEVHLAEQNVTEAIRQYEQYRTLLAENMGIEPSPGLRRLMQDAIGR
jgi:DNA-binding SARP family transcriptional activator